MVCQVLHEHETALSAASPANRSRRLIKCAKESARYPAACATAPRCSKSTTSLQRFSATQPASDQGAPQKCSLPENDAGYAPNPNRAGESSNTYSPSPTTSNFEIGSSLRSNEALKR